MPVVVGLSPAGVPLLSGLHLGAASSSSTSAGQGSQSALGLPPHQGSPPPRTLGTAVDHQALPAPPSATTSAFVPTTSHNLLLTKPLLPARSPSLAALPSLPASPEEPPETESDHDDARERASDPDARPSGDESDSDEEELEDEGVRESADALANSEGFVARGTKRPNRHSGGRDRARRRLSVEPEQDGDDEDYVGDGEGKKEKKVKAKAQVSSSVDVRLLGWDSADRLPLLGFSACAAQACPAPQAVHLGRAGRPLVKRQARGWVRLACPETDGGAGE